MENETQRVTKNPALGQESVQSSILEPSLPVTKTTTEKASKVEKDTQEAYSPEKNFPRVESEQSSIKLRVKETQKVKSTFEQSRKSNATTNLAGRDASPELGLQSPLSSIRAAAVNQREDPTSNYATPQFPNSPGDIDLKAIPNHTSEQINPTNRADANQDVIRVDSNQSSLKAPINVAREIKHPKKEVKDELTDRLDLSQKIELESS